MDGITAIAERAGSLMLEGGVEVKIINVEGGGMRLIFDRPLAYCGDAVVFQGDEEDSAAGPLRRMKIPPPVVAKSAKRDPNTGMGFRTPASWT